MLQSQRRIFCVEKRSVIKAMIHAIVLTVTLCFWPAIAAPEIRDCKTQYYNISGEDGNELLEQMRAKSRVKGGYFAQTQYKYNYNCKKLTMTCTVRLPRWVDYDSSTNVILREKWDKFYAALVAHEQGHVDIFNSGMQLAVDAVSRMKCKAATRKYNQEFRKLSTKQKTYDAENDHGKKLGASFGGSNYMGIAYSPKTDAIGWAFDAETKEAATQTALKNCPQKDCKLVVWANGEKNCVAVAKGARGGYGYAYGEGQEKAETKAMAACAKFTKDCSIRKTVCAGQGEMQ